MPKPGYSSATVASIAQAVHSTETIQAPARPPGTVYGRGTWPCVYRSFTRVGKIST